MATIGCTIFGTSNGTHFVIAFCYSNPIKSKGGAENAHTTHRAGL